MGISNSGCLQKELILEDGHPKTITVLNLTFLSKKNCVLLNTKAKTKGFITQFNGATDVLRVNSAGKNKLLIFPILFDLVKSPKKNQKNWVHFDTFCS